MEYIKLKSVCKMDIVSSMIYDHLMDTVLFEIPYFLPKF